MAQPLKTTLSLKSCQIKLDMDSLKPKEDPRTLHSNLKLAPKKSIKAIDMHSSQSHASGIFAQVLSGPAHKSNKPSQKIISRGAALKAKNYRAFV